MLFSFFTNKSLHLGHIRRFKLGCILILDGGECLVRGVSTKKKKYFPLDQVLGDSAEIRGWVGPFH